MKNKKSHYLNLNKYHGGFAATDGGFVHQAMISKHEHTPTWHCGCHMKSCRHCTHCISCRKAKPYFGY